MPDLHSRKLVVPAWIIGLNMLLVCAAQAQSDREINQQAQFWWSVNSTTKVTDKLGFVSDFHIRRTDFVEDPSFYFLRFGGNVWITERFTLTFGYAHMWKAPAQEDWHTWTNEDRIYQQLQYLSKLGSTSMLQRLRTEQRWQEQVQNDVLTGQRAYSNRVRYLLSFTIPVAKNPSMPQLVLSDEILIQFGPSIVMNTFDQNRFFVGIKKNLTPRLSFDFGYMPVYQEKSSGYQYDLNHTLRWFFYFTPDLRKHKSLHEPVSNEE